MKQKKIIVPLFTASSLTALIFTASLLCSCGNNAGSNMTQEDSLDIELNNIDNEVANQNIDNHECVDLGLSVKWATCNIGASSPNACGDYFAWGETSPKASYLSENCFDRTSDGNSFLRYNKDYTELYSDNDAATVCWGSKWRMPTEAEARELVEKCKWTRTKLMGVSGYEVRSNVNDNRIFIPATGFKNADQLMNETSLGTYWTSSLDPTDIHYAFTLDIDANGVSVYYDRRFIGRPIRPVCK